MSIKTSSARSAAIAPKVILIGGPSNVGKSTLARSLSSRLGWHCTSTDTLARYPGRPWGGVRQHVVEHYLSLSPEQLIEDAIRHYMSMWPQIRDIIIDHACNSSSESLVLEGSALWPESVVTLGLEGVEAIWLTASDGFLQERIYNASGYDGATAQEQVIIEKFVGRAQRYNQRMLHIVRQLGLPWLHVQEQSSLESLTDALLSRLGIAI